LTTGIASFVGRCPPGTGLSSGAGAARASVGAGWSAVSAFAAACPDRAAYSVTGSIRYRFGLAMLMR
jgi:hypothetical protein